MTSTSLITQSHSLLVFRNPSLHNLANLQRNEEEEEEVIQVSSRAALISNNSSLVIVLIQEETGPRHFRAMEDNGKTITKVAAVVVHNNGVKIVTKESVTN